MQRPSVDLPQPDSPTRPSVSPSATLSVTSSTACTRATSRESTPFRIGKYFFRLWISTSALPFCVCGSLTRPRAPRRRSSRSRRPRLSSTVSQQRSRWPRVLDAVSQLGLLEALLERVRAARPELAALRQVDQRRRRALDRVQLLRLRPVEPRDRAEQAPGVRVLRVVEEVPLRAALDDPAGVHDEDLVGDLGDDAEVVRDQDHGRVEVVVQAVDQLEDLRLDRHVERRRRLVGDQDVRVARERHRDHRALAHAARELVRVVVDARLRVRDPDLAQQLDRAALRRLACRCARAW